MQVHPSLQNETTQEPSNWVPVAVRTKRLVYQDLLVGFSITPLLTNRTIMRLTLGTPDVRSPLPGYYTTNIHALFNNLGTLREKDSTEIQSNIELDPLTKV